MSDADQGPLQCILKLHCRTLVGGGGSGAEFLHNSSPCKAGKPTTEKAAAHSSLTLSSLTLRGAVPSLPLALSRALFLGFPPRPPPPPTHTSSCAQSEHTVRGQPGLCREEQRGPFERQVLRVNHILSAEALGQFCCGKKRECERDCTVS